MDAVITVGTSCLRNGCKATYQDESSLSEICRYHPGEAEFHEGSKGWVCCKPRMLEYSEFLKIPGCAEGKHQFVPDKTKAVKVRYDFYQIGNHVYVTFYSKNVKKAESSFKFEPQKVHVHLALSNGDIYEDEIFLAKGIVPEQSTSEFLSTKVEVKLRKATAEEWNHFDLAKESVILKS